MKKLIIKSSLFIVIIMLPVLIINSMYLNTNYYKAKDEVLKFSQIPENIEILNVGSSHLQGKIIYDFTEKNSFDFAMTSQPFYYDLQILKKYRDNISEDAIIIIPISYFSHSFDYLKLNDSEDNNMSYRYYRILDSNQIINSTLVRNIKNRWLPIFSAGKDARHIVDDIDSVEYIPYYSSTRHVDENELNNIAVWKAKSWLNDVMAPENEKNYYEKLNFSDLKSLIEFCKQEKWRPILISTPMTETLTSQFDKDFIKDWQEKNNAFAKENNVEYYDYSQDSRFVNNIEFFVDSDHLSYLGSVEFTKTFFSDAEIYP